MTILVLLVLVVVALLVLSARRGDDRPPPNDDGMRPGVPDDASEPMPPSRSSVAGPFGLGQAYTRAEIHSALGGGLQDYLPHAGGVVVCGCFNPVLNPDAPDVVLPGFGIGIERWAEVFARQGTAVPCFLKRGPNVWEYVGDFRVRELSREPAEVERWAATAGREGNVSMVLHLEEEHA